MAGGNNDIDIFFFHWNSSPVLSYSKWSTEVVPISMTNRSTEQSPLLRSQSQVEDYRQVITPVPSRWNEKRSPFAYLYVNTGGWLHQIGWRESKKLVAKEKIRQCGHCCSDGSSVGQSHLTFVRCHWRRNSYEPSRKFYVHTGYQTNFRRSERGPELGDWSYDEFCLVPRFWTADTRSLIGDFWKKKVVSGVLFSIFFASDTHRTEPERWNLDYIKDHFRILWKSVSPRFTGMIIVDSLKVLESQMAVERSVTCFILAPERKWTVPVLSPDRII